jgi:16S rRNA (cytidine1402-2'-O)-methyltransferase
MCDSSQTALAPGLYLVATPIGNLGDLSGRALATLTQAALVASEDTRTVRRLFPQGVRIPPLVSLTEHNTGQRIPMLLSSARDSVVAIVSEAGMPGIADPGARVVDAAHEAAIPIRVIPGPSAVVAAVAASGFDASDFAFLGFVPRRAAALAERLRSAAREARTLVLFESPRRLSATLSVVASALDDPRCSVSREISKIHEEHVRGRASELAERYREARGECVVVVESPPLADVSETDLAAYMAEMRRAGARRSAAAVEAARRFGCPRDSAYALWGDD